MVLEQTSHDLLIFNQPIRKLEHKPQAFFSWFLWNKVTVQTLGSRGIGTQLKEKSKASFGSLQVAAPYSPSIEVLLSSCSEAALQKCS